MSLPGLFQLKNSFGGFYENFCIPVSDIACTILGFQNFMSSIFICSTWIWPRFFAYHFISQNKAPVNVYENVICEIEVPIRNFNYIYTYIYTYKYIALPILLTKSKASSSNSNVFHEPKITYLMYHSMIVD